MGSGFACRASLGLALALLVPSIARAADAPTPDPPEPVVKLLGGSLDVGVAARREVPAPTPPGETPPTGASGPREIASFSPMLRMDLRVRDEVELYGSAGVVTVISNGPEGKDTVARPSNIAFGGRRIWEWGGDKYRAANAGFEFAIPTGYARSDDETDAYEYALAGRGGLGPWEWMPRTLSFIAPAGISAQMFRRWVIGGSAAVAGMFPSASDVDTPTIAAQVAGGARFVLPWLGLGLHASGVYNGRHPTEKTQAAITPSVDTNLCRRGGRRIAGSLSPTSAQCPVFVSAKFNFNLDAPYGFVSNDEAMGIWGLQFALGWAVF